MNIMHIFGKKGKQTNNTNGHVQLGKGTQQVRRAIGPEGRQPRLNDLGDVVAFCAEFGVPYEVRGDWVYANGHGLTEEVAQRCKDAGFFATREDYKHNGPGVHVIIHKCEDTTSHFGEFTFDGSVKGEQRRSQL